MTNYHKTKLVMFLDALQPKAHQGMSGEDFKLYSELWEFVAITCPFGLAGAIAPSEVEIIEECELPPVFEEFINSLDLS